MRTRPRQRARRKTCGENVLGENVRGGDVRGANGRVLRPQTRQHAPLGAAAGGPRRSAQVQPGNSKFCTQCYYEGYVEGYPNSVVILSTCSGLRGLLQFEKVSYGIEPLEVEVEFQHLLYKLKNENNMFAVHTENSRSLEQKPMDYSIFISEKSDSAQDLIPLYVEMHIVVDKVLYDYLGSDSMLATDKVIEIIGLVNSVFAQLNVTIVLSSLELWSDKNKIFTVGEADELLRRFLEWKKSYLTLRPHDIAYLFMYRDNPDELGATFPGKMCSARSSAGIALYFEDITLEAFSVIVTQMLGLNLGISYDDSNKCQCSGAICVMNPEAVQSSGVKTFSNCSLSDFKSFTLNMDAKCLQNKPQMQVLPRAVCGNGKVETPEDCDCGTEDQCGHDSCCDPQRCVLKQGSNCDLGLCCSSCQIQPAGSPCRPSVHPECDLPEFCNGTSPACPNDVTIINGHLCKAKYICYAGDCHDLNARCESLFGKGSQNAPFACYEEIQSQIDRFGNCGKEKGQYKFCQWRNLICGRLICTYPTRTPYIQKDVAVLYAYVRNVICITLDYSLHGSVVDPLVVNDGSECDTERVCINRECVEARFLKKDSLNCSAKCSGHGVCTSEKECHCESGWSGDDCNTKFREADTITDLIMERDFWKSTKNQWLLGLYITLPVLIIAILTAITWKRLKRWFSKEEESKSSKSKGSIQTYSTRSRSESSRETDISK
ncbi:disintegrin and metalloproteinase domain-containing protein 32 [Pipistrellus kuhlii]|uniref:disintegrin and metalloproteinase domain-containing protein 32 n=1 Tax=Pipistrellus kuhlii TaxID=59472 RepID=UPI001E26F534|nr:disintegrin and metalloproteinase domain-containing protein 32 [Pipistrellus kuhlii]